MWFKHDRGGNEVPALPPVHVARNLLVDPDLQLLPLTGVTSVPHFAPDGHLILEPGYDVGTGMIYQPPAGFSVGRVPDTPSPLAVELAKKVLLDQLMGDFPFVGEADRAHALSAELLFYCRQLVVGSTPLYFVFKPSPGTGATLLVQAIADAVLGHPGAVLTEARSEEEWSRTIFAKLLSGPQLVLLDNIVGRLDSSALAAAITSEYFEGRVLGRSETKRVPVRCVWFATGTNPGRSRELLRRVVPVRLDARLERPETRTGFRHGNLRQWARKYRNLLVRSSLILIQAWVTAGRPKGRKIVGGFESFSEVLGGILDVIGVPGFLENLDESHQYCDGQEAAFASFIRKWFKEHGEATLGAGDLLPLSDELGPGGQIRRQQADPTREVDPS